MIKWKSDCCDSPMANVALLINEHYGTCARCGKEALAIDPEMLKPVTPEQFAGSMRKRECKIIPLNPSC